jgi:DNA-directed RNA polymerase specialized sigma24 family protein
VEAEPPLTSRELTAEGLARMLARIDPDPARAADGYETIRARLVRLFAWRGCGFPEAAADLTMDRVARRLGDGVEVAPPDPWAYFAGVARNVFQEVLREQGREQAAAQAWTQRDERDEDPRLPCLDRCLDRLPPAARDLILRYHDGEGRRRIHARAALVRELGLDATALRVRAHRVRQRLEACVEGCLRGEDGVPAGPADLVARGAA